jgi:mannose-6-phosphate isomerase class I
MNSPGLWKLTPAVVTKPWGLVHEEVLAFTGIEVGLGEFWLASAQTGPGNYSNVVAEPALRRTLAELLVEAADAGGGALEDLIGARAAGHLRETPHRGKTEAWCVRVAQGRTGVAAGPATPEDASRLKHLILTEGLPPDVTAWSDEVRRLFGLVEPLRGGEVFLAPAGTLHTMFAVGRDSRLIIDEIQQGYGECLLPTLTKILCVQNNLLSVQVHPNDATVAAAAAGEMKVAQDLQANPTVRLYDFGRRPGEDPELGFRLVDPAAGLRRVSPAAAEPGDGHRIEVMLADPHFVRCRVSLGAGRTAGLMPPSGSYRVLHGLEGEAELTATGRALRMRRGETVFVPACLEAAVRVEAATDCAFFDDGFGEVVPVARFLARNGASAEQIEALLGPPRAVGGAA